MANIIEPRVLKGFRDFLPAQEIERKRILEVLERMFRTFGFVPIDTPVLEYTEVLLGKAGGETEKQVYRFLDNGQRDVSMRFDLTVPFARFMAANLPSLYLPFKRYHVSKVWRGENTQRGRYREFMQCDFDTVGVDSASADFEILLLMQRSFRALGIDRFAIHLSHRGVFNRLLSRLGLADRSVEVLRIVDKLQKIGEEQVISQLGEFAPEAASREILHFIRREEDFGATLAKMQESAGGECEEIRRLREIRTYIEELSLQDAFVLDPSITRGLDYYTGIVFETYLTDVPGIGSVCSGGRYNDLASLYSKEQLPGVGSSIGIDRLMAAIEELGSRPERQGYTDVLVFCLDEALGGYYHRLAAQIREQGISCEVYPEAKKLGVQFTFAEKKGIPLGLICGESEVAAGTVTLKDLRSRENFPDLTLEAGTAKIRSLSGRS